MDHLIRFIQTHESFRRSELEALSTLASISFETVFYSPTSPFCIVHFQPDPSSSEPPSSLAKRFISRSVLSKGIYELWGSGLTYEALHEDVRRRSSHLWLQYKDVSFRFSIDGYLGKRSSTEQTSIINSFRYLGFEGPISLSRPDVEFTIFEEWDTPDPLRPDLHSSPSSTPARTPKSLHLARHISTSTRSLIAKHSLKTRPYISTTSMDAELALVTATLALARPGSLFLDPFVGTGGFMVAAAEFGSWVLGSDIDGRSFRGKSQDRALSKGVGANFRKYGLEHLFGDCIISDLTNTPFRSSSSSSAIPTTTCNSSARYLSGILTDPPYGVREGLKVLGRKPAPHHKTFLNPNIDPSDGIYMINDTPAHLLPGYVAPKRAYSFTAMLDDILDFAAKTLVDDGRLAFWMPTANGSGREQEEASEGHVEEGGLQGKEEEEEEEEEPIPIPTHPHLHLLHSCVQPFNKWSRRLLVYRRRSEEEIAEQAPPLPLPAIDSTTTTTTTPPTANAFTAGTHADDVNPFRRAYFQGFRNTK